MRMGFGLLPVVCLGSVLLQDLIWMKERASDLFGSSLRLFWGKLCAALVWLPHFPACAHPDRTAAADLHLLFAEHSGFTARSSIYPLSPLGSSWMRGLESSQA